MPAWLIDLAGWFPAIFFPLASTLQLTKLLQSKSSEGVSVLTWVLMAWANLCMYTYTEKFFEIQALGLVLNAGIQALVVVMVLKYRNQEPAEVQ